MSDATIGIRVDPTGAVTGARTVKRSLNDIGGGARSALSAVQMLTGALASIGVGLGLRDALQTIGSFQESLSGVQAVTRATANEMKTMEREARRLGATTRYTAGQAAEGMRFLGMAGFETSNIIKAMPSVLNLATAATMDLGRAADITSNIMSAFGIEAEETARIADALAMAASSANTTVEQLGDAMKYVGPAAAAFNVSMEDAAAVTSTLSQAGIQGSMAGTGLRRVLSSLVNPTAEAARVIQSMGLSLEEVNPLSNDLVGIIEALAEAGLDGADAMQIFGDRGGPAILALVSQIEDLRRLVGVINDAEGAAKQAADTLQDNIPGALRNLASAIEESVHQMGDRGLAGAFRELIDTATNVVRIWNGMGDTIEEHIEYYERMARTVEVLAYAIGTTLAARAIPAATAALYSMAAAMAMTPIGAFSLALGGLVAAYTLLRGEIQETQTVEEEHQSALDRMKQIRGELTTATDDLFPACAGMNRSPMTPRIVRARGARGDPWGGARGASVWIAASAFGLLAMTGEGGPRRPHPRRPERSEGSGAVGAPDIEVLRCAQDDVFFINLHRTTSPMGRCLNAPLHGLPRRPSASSQ